MSAHPNVPPPQRGKLAAQLWARLSARQRQYALMAGIVGSGVGLLWLVFALSENAAPPREAAKRQDGSATLTQIGVMPAGGQVNPVDQWVGSAGRKLAQYENEREEQGRLNRERQAFEARTLQRFLDLEQKLLAAQAPTPKASSPAAVVTAAPGTSPMPRSSLPPGPPSGLAPGAMPPAAALPPPLPPTAMRNPGNAAWLPPPPIPRQAMAGPFATDPLAASGSPASVPAIVRVTVSRPAPNESTAATKSQPVAGANPTSEPRTVATFLPVSFTRGTLLGGLDAPTGGQAQSNPHPVLIRLSDNSVLPNQFRGSYRECFVVAAGYGDISSERAYLRTESLSCVRADGATLEVRIQGSVYGEDGKVGMRGRLVTKQGQMLGNALLAGVVSGIGQGLATSSTDYATSALGTVATTAGGADGYRAGVGSGVGRALDRLAQYYIKLAENTFPVIEVDAGRTIDVVITRGVRIDVPVTTAPAARERAPSSLSSPTTRYQEIPQDDND